MLRCIPCRLLSPALLVASLVACADTPLTSPTVTPTRSLSKSEGRGAFHRYVAIGTSVSMGWQSDGVNHTTQETSWPAQLARLAHREMTLPLIALLGCGAPLAAPLASGVCISREPAAAPFASRVCAPNLPGVELPADNVAINGARTIHALEATPENPDPSNDRLYARVHERDHSTRGRAARLRLLRAERAV